MANKSQQQLDADSEKARRARINGDDEPVPQTEVHTYPDGSQVVGVPPFPEKSPKERALTEKEDVRPMHIPKGVKTSGEAAASESGSLTAEQFREKVEQQVEADVTSGKDPATPNPTTSSDKPALANTVTADQVEKSFNPENPQDLDRLTKGVKPDVDATDEQIAAAALQVARETKGLVSDEKTPAAGKKSK